MNNNFNESNTDFILINPNDEIGRASCRERV